MPSASITFTSCGNTYVYYTATYSGTVSSLPTASEDNYNDTVYKFSSFSITCNGNTGTTTRCQHDALGKSAAQKVTATLSYNTYTCSRTWEDGYYGNWSSWKNSGNPSSVYPTVPEDTSTKEWQVKVISSPPAALYQLQYRTRTYHSGYYDYYWGGGTAHTTSDSISFYAPPGSFSFDYYDSTNYTYDISQFITKGITNLKSFQTHATKWKNWKNQDNDAGSCPSWGTGHLTAKTLNDIYAYCGLSRSNSVGDKILKTLFDALEKAVST